MASHGAGGSAAVDDNRNSQDKDCRNNMMMMRIGVSALHFKGIIYL